MVNYVNHFNTTKTPKNQAIPGKTMIKNESGGFVFEVSDWSKLKRFLILGTEKGSFYASEKNMTIEMAEATLNCIKEDGLRVVNEVVEISDSGRAIKNDAALFVLSLASCPKFADAKTVSFALECLPKVARTGTHLFNFFTALKTNRGMGRSVRRALANFYLHKTPEALIKFVTKYKQRNGVSQRDLLRLSHPKTEDKTTNTIFKYVVSGEMPERFMLNPALTYMQAVEELKTANNKRVIDLVKTLKMPEEVIPNDKLTKEVMEVLIETSGLTWLFRNLANLSKDGILISGNFDAINKVCARLTDQDALVKGRIHPIQVLNALISYKKGTNRHGSWTPVAKVIDALDNAFYLAFKVVTPTNKRFCLGLDISGSMHGSLVAGIEGLSCREACAALALVTEAVEQNTVIVGYGTKIHELTISANQRLDDVVDILKKIPGENTDCSLPMQHCLNKKIVVDVFVVYTDAQDNSGFHHPIQVFDKYKKKINNNAKLIIIPMCANRFSIAEQNREDVREFIGFDTQTPKLIELFTNGEI